MDNRRHLSLPPRNPMILVTGGAGFIGANFVLNWLAASDEKEKEEMTDGRIKQRIKG